MTAPARPADYASWPRERQNEWYEKHRGSTRKEGGKGPAVEDDKPKVFAPSPFRWRDPSKIPRRQFVYGRHLTRGTVSATVAPGGLGKSALKLTDAIAMAAGRNLIGERPVAPLRVWYVNLEDDRQEVERRIAAVLMHFRLSPEEVGDRLFFDGRDTAEIIVATQGSKGVLIATPVIEALTKALADKLDVLIVDPFVSAHRVPENDNVAIDAVVKTLARIAGEANVAIELVHHSRKTNGGEITAEDSRGGSATVAATRSTRVLNRMSTELAAEHKLDDKTRRRTFRMDDDKLNLAPPQDARWFQIQNVGLGNGESGESPDQDFVGVVDRWRLPSPFDDVSVADLRSVQTKVAAGNYRADPQAADWVGAAVAEVLLLDASEKADRLKINKLLKTWTSNGMFKVVERDDESRRVRKFTEVDKWANN